MGTPALNIDAILVFTFVFLRISAMLVMIPVMGEKAVPIRVKAGLALLMALLVFPSVLEETPSMPADT